MATSEPKTTPQAVLTAYFDALTRHDLDAIAAAWAPDGHCHVAGQADATGPDGVRAYWAELFGALPDMRVGIDELIAEGEQVAVKWSATGTFAGPGITRASSRPTRGSISRASTSSGCATA